MYAFAIWLRRRRLVEQYIFEQQFDGLIGRG
jgi:hypothetical protein